MELEAEVGIGETDLAISVTRTTSSPTTSSAFQRSLRYPVFASSVITIRQYASTILPLSRNYPASTLLLALLLAVERPSRGFQSRCGEAEDQSQPANHAEDSAYRLGSPVLTKRMRFLPTTGMEFLPTTGVLGDAPRTVENWVHRFERSGFAGLTEGERPGRPSRLGPEQLAEMETALRQTPGAAGVEGGGVWDGKTLSRYLDQQFGVDLKARQWQERKAAHQDRLDLACIEKEGRAVTSYTKGTDTQQAPAK